MSDNLCLYRDIIQYLDDRFDSEKPRLGKPNTVGAGGAIVAIDLEKAYDKTDREIVWKIMAKIGYPPIFINWLRALYVGATAKILNGRKAAGIVDGVSCLRQGCPLSMHLFVLYMDPLLIKLDEILEGIPISGEHVKVRALVDDLTVFVNSLADVEKTETVTEKWCCWTGASVTEASPMPWHWEAGRNSKFGKLGG